MGLTSLGGNRRIPALVVALAATVMLALALGATRAGATELVYWANYDAKPSATISFANLDGSGGGALNIGGLQIKSPEGMAYDPVTNRLYVANEGVSEKGEIAYVNLDGSSGGVFTAPGAVIENPEGIAIDPATRIMYWANSKEAGSIGWANLNGTIGGTLNTTGATTKFPYRLALDPVGGRVYWSTFDEATEITSLSFANVNNTGGGNLSLSAAPNSIYGLAADPTSGRLYWLDSSTGKEVLAFTGLLGGGVNSISLAGADKGGYGIAVDPVLGKAYWGNYGNEKSATNAIGFTSLSGVNGGFTPVAAPVDGPQDPVIIKSPGAAGAPQLTQSKALLSCSQGTWAGDYPGSSVYQSPRAYVYQWSLNGVPIAGATAPTLTATTPGAYACTVTATNQAGSASQSGATAATVTKAKFALVAKKKKAQAKPGKLAKFKVQTSNVGDLKSTNAKLCLKVPKKAKKSLKAFKCASFKPIGAGIKRTSTVKVKVKPNAVPGSYKLKITLPTAKALSVTLKVLG